ncbi:MAG TPA: xylose isomerase, partial [Edaphobacter sp.]
MSSYRPSSNALDRRHFLRGAGGSLAAGALLGVTGAQQRAEAQEAKPESIVHGSAFRPMTESEKVARIAANSYPIRWIFKNHDNVGSKDTVAKMKAKYGEITLLDFPAFTKKTFPGVTK